MKIYGTLLTPVLLFIFIPVSRLHATTYFSDPVEGSMDNPGSASEPWGSLATIMDSGKSFLPGDSIVLIRGNHGTVRINGSNAEDVYITAKSDEKPVLQRLLVGDQIKTSHWSISHLTIRSTAILGGHLFLVELYPNSNHITLTHNSIQSIEQTDFWVRNDWRSMTHHGVRAQGDNHRIEDNDIRNIALGMSIESSHTLVSGNTVQYFAIDGIRILASNGVYTNNRILDNIVVYTNDENHYDGIQSYTCCPVGSDTIDQIILERNLVINSTDSSRKWQGPMQGVGAFDGFYTNWLVENNIIITDHWHGITLLGAINCKIINNTVIDPYDVSAVDPFDPASGRNVGPAWIRIAAHKNGSRSYGNTVRNNLTADLQCEANSGNIDHNKVIGASSNYDQYFVDVAAFDLHLISTAPVIDQGSPDDAPSRDFDGNLRPQGPGIDLGAFEYTISTTSNSRQNQSFAIEIYPNPTRHMLNLKIGNQSLEAYALYNMTGQLLISQVSPSDHRIDISGLQAGMYLIQLKLSSGTITTKFVKE